MTAASRPLWKKISKLCLAGKTHMVFIMILTCKDNLNENFRLKKKNSLKTVASCQFWEKAFMLGHAQKKQHMVLINPFGIIID